jgi:hypothetical protein
MFVVITPGLMGVPTFTSKLEKDICTFIKRHNANARPTRSTKSVNEILASVKHFCQKAK